MLNAEDLQCFQPSKKLRNVRWILKKGGCSSNREAGSKLGVFAMIVKISLGLLKFRNLSEIFAM